LRFTERGNGSYSNPTRRATAETVVKGRLCGITTKASNHANRNAGFIRQAGEWHWGCRMNPAFRWWCQDAARHK
jgi:hypothetical protein